MLQRNKWVPRLLLLSVPLFNGTSALAQGTATNAETKRSCSQIITGNSNQVTISCVGMDETDAKKMAALLNKILANQIDPEALMSKIDELLKLASADDLEVRARELSDRLAKFYSEWMGERPDANVSRMEQRTYMRDYDVAVKDLAHAFKARLLNNDGINVCLAMTDPVWFWDVQYCAGGLRMAADSLKKRRLARNPTPAAVRP